MAALTLPQHTEIVFRPYVPWLVIRIGLFVSLAIGSLVRAFWLHDPRWLMGAGLLAVIALVVLLSHLAHAIILSGASLICRRGVIRVRESVIPISRLNYEIRQSLPGRVLGYGTVRIHLNGATIVIHHIAPIRALQAEIARLQTEILMAPINWRIGA